MATATSGRNSCHQLGSAGRWGRREAIGPPYRRRTRRARWAWWCFRYDAPLCFANAEDFHQRALAAVGVGTEWFVLNAEANIEVDFTVRAALDELRRELAARGITFAMARVKRVLAEQLAADGLLDTIGPDHAFPTLPGAVAGYLRAYRETHGRLPKGLTVATLPPDPFTGGPPTTQQPDRRPRGQ